MIRPVGVICALALVAGCSRAGEPQDDAKTSDPAPRPSASAGPGSSTTASSGGLSGEVSSLAGARSDLNVRVTEFGTVVDLPADALFEYDKADLTPAAQVQLLRAAELIRKSPPGAIQVIGHTDSHGEDAYNQALSEARARTVADWFSQQVGVRQRQFQVSGKGEAAPIAPNETASGADDPHGRTKNRRVEVVLPKG